MIVSCSCSGRARVVHVFVSCSGRGLFSSHCLYEHGVSSFPFFFAHSRALCAAMSMACVSFPFFFRALARVVCMSMACVSFPFFFRALARAVCMSMACVSFPFFFARAQIVLVSCTCSCRVQVVDFFFVRCVYEYGVSFLSFFFRALTHTVCMSMA